ncbi:MAG: c-type cytochrome biogenesis protein CcmI [Chromatiaceae bacterium]|nr:c-type cytochrome biogenesis protein CcmI [Chromatiaceae bacterium]
MTIFWILIAGLAGLALLFVIPPLLSQRAPTAETNQDQLNLDVFRQQLIELEADMEAGKLEKGQYQDARHDLERELLHDVQGQGAPSAPAAPGNSPMTALLLALALPAFAIALYLAIGDSAIIPRLEGVAGETAQAPGHGAADAQQAASLEIMVERLAARMEQNPDQLEGWLMLGRTYVALDQPDKGAAALARALALAPQNPEVMINLAQAQATAANGQLGGRPAELIAAALVIEPKHATGRWLNGLVAYQAGDFPLAVQRWESLAIDLDAAGEDASELRQFIADAREQGGLPPATTSPPAPAKATPASVSSTTATAGPAAGVSPAAKPGPTPAATQGPAIQVAVSLAEPLKSKVDANQSLFIYAKAASGPPMPLAVKRLRVADLPVTVTLDDSLAMTPEMRLSSFPQVMVGARISASGQAVPQSGDLEGERGPLTTAETSSLQLVIDRVRP